jgi:predicted kinase
MTSQIRIVGEKLLELARGNEQIHPVALDLYRLIGFQERNERDLASRTFTNEEMDLIRQWFNATEDAAPKYLEQRDYDLADKVCDVLGIKRPRRPAALSRT